MRHSRGSSFHLTSINEVDNQPHPGFDGLAWQVHKFGGTSVANAECFLKAARIVEDQLGIPADLPEDETLLSAFGDTNCNLAVVVSAMGGKPKVTDLLLDTVKFAAKRDTDSQSHHMALVLKKHEDCLNELFNDSPATKERLMAIIQKDLLSIGDILKTVSLMKWQAERILELVSGFGEIWSAQILNALLQTRSEKRTQKMKEVSSGSLDELLTAVHHEFVFLDARKVIIIDEDVAIQDGAVAWEESMQKLKSVYAKTKSSFQSKHNGENSLGKSMIHFIVTGYVATNTHGVACTLKRDGSDYSAAIMGRLLQSNSIQIWTDVDGVLSADPRRVPNAQILTEVSYNEAMELAYFGAKVIHPKTMQPAISSNPQIPIYIRNTFKASLRGTRIYTSSSSRDGDMVVCGFTSIENMALINVEGSGMIGVRGILRRIFTSLDAADLNIMLISQASSEHSITVATREWEAAAAKETIEEEFAKEIRNNRITNIDVQSPCSIIAAVGDGMTHRTGVSGRFFTALGDAKINILAIAQGSSERNISAVVKTEDSSRALRAVHAAFRLSHTTIRAVIIGMNELGDSLIKLLQERRAALRSTYELDLQVVAVLPHGNSNDTICLEKDVDGGANSITMKSYSQVTSGKGTSNTTESSSNLNGSTAILCSGGLPDLLQRLIRTDCTNHVIFDCTNDENVGKYHASWLRAGVDVVSANNTGLSGSKAQRDEINSAERSLGKQSARYLVEVTVGGGLPIVNTTRTLLQTGDKIRRIDGIFSVSLSYIMFRVSPPADLSRCTEFDQLSCKGAFEGDIRTSSSADIGKSCSFSTAVKEAIALGLMEEDPTKDLNNEYTARVLMILAKEIGLYNIDMQDILASSDKLSNADDYQQITSDIDDAVQKRVTAAQAKGCVVRQICSIDIATQDVEIAFREVPDHHIFAVTPPSCECVRFFTHRHMTYPLIVQGPSAGADSTASALLADLLQHSRVNANPRAVSLSRRGTSAALKDM